MKYKVGDRVKIKESLKEGHGCCNYVTEDMEKYAGKVMTIRAVLGKTYHMKEDNGEYCGDGWYWTEDMIEGLATFTKSDLKDEDIVTYRNGEKLINAQGMLFNKEKGISNFISNYNEDLIRKDKECKETDIIKVERPTGYKTIFERKEEILDEAEKRYLRDVIRPFRDKVTSICKTRYNDENQFIRFILSDDDKASLPNFKINTMYLNMQEDKEYTLEQLGL